MRMADFTYAELLSELGNSAAEFGKHVVNGAANHVCALYAHYPGFFMPPGGSDIARGVYNNLCMGRPAGLPSSPPPPQFAGGQCADAYDVTVSYNENGIAQTRGRRVIGPIYGVGAVSGDPNVPNETLNALVIKSAGSTSSGPQLFPNSSGQAWTKLSAGNTPLTYTNIQVTSLVRVNGQPDNCGSMPSGYPPVSGLPNNGDGVVEGTHSNGGVYVIPVLLKPSLTGEVNVDVGGINVKFDLSGAKVGGDGAPSQAILDAINEGVAQIVDGQCACADIPNADSYDLEDILDSEGTTQDGIEGLEWVRIKITSAPANAKSQSGGGASDVFYAGWFSFVANDGCLPREPIHFLDSIFRAPEGCTGYEYCLYQGYRGSATEYKRPVTVPVV